MTIYKTILSVIKIFPRAFGGYSIHIIILAILGFATAMLEGIGITALIPLFSFFDEGTRQPTDFISQAIEKAFSLFNLPLTLPSILIFIIILFFLKFIFSIIYVYITIKIQTQHEKQTMNRLLKATLSSNWPYLVRQKLGELETLIKIDAHSSSGMLLAISTIIMLCVSLLAYLLIAINISKTVTVIAFIFGAAIIILYKPLFRRTHSLSKQLSQNNVSIAHFINESLLGIKTIKASGVEKRIIFKGERLFDFMKDLELRLVLIRKITTESIQPISIIFVTTIIAFAFYRTSYNLGALAALVYLINRIFQYLQSIQSVLNESVKSLPYVKNVVSYIDEAEKFKEIDETKTYESLDLKEKLSFRSVSFNYPDERRGVKEISFDINTGKTVGIIGTSGAGKTTTFDLILRLLKPTNGQILIDGKDINSIEISNWRQKISYVSQDIFMLNDTVLNNIKFFDSSITREEAEKATKTAQIYEFIQTLPDKFDTIVGERGNFLSAGQRQRLALARALARKPLILLLDEATSALDNESEYNIQTAIEELRGEITILVIAHRLSTVLNVDELLVMEDGEIVERGNPRELLQNKDTYFYKSYNLRK